MGCCSGQAQKLYSKWLATAPISVPRSASSASSIPGTRNSNSILMSTVSFPPADPPPITPTAFAHPCQVLRRLAASALPQRLDRLLQTTLRRTRVRPAVSRPLYSPRRHLQPSLARIDRRPGHLSLA